MVTMQDVATRAQVSLATVSFVLNRSKPISEATRIRVEQAMAELNYRRNPIGTALARGRTMILAMLYPALQRPLSGTAARFFTAAAERARHRGYSLVLWPIRNRADDATALMSSGLVDGVVLMEVELDDERVAVLDQGTTPFALIGRTHDAKGLPFVDIDFAASVRETIDVLVVHGHTRYALVDRGTSGFDGFGAPIRVRASFLEVIAERGLSGIVVSCPEDPGAGRTLGARFSTEHPEVTALLVHNELAAPGVIAGLRDAGVAVPESVSIVSIASSEDMAAMADPPLTFMRAPSAELGRLGVDMIIDRIDHPERSPTPTLLPCELVPGATVANAPPGR